MTNYYEELKIDRTLGISEINRILNQKESYWIRRELTTPEKATMMLALIIQARKVFQTTATRFEYDKALNESTNAPKSDAEKRNELLGIWFNRAKEYYDTKQYDLAKVAIEKAISFSNPIQDDIELYALAADILCKNNNTSSALEYINKAIVIQPEVPDYYIKKGLIYERIAQLNKAANRYVDVKDNYHSMRRMLELAVTKARASGDKYIEGVATGTLAFVLYYYLNDKENAEKIAKDTVDNKNDSWGNAQRVLDDIKEKRQQEAKIMEEQRRHKEQLLEAERKRKRKEHINSIFCILRRLCFVAFLGWEVLVFFNLFKNNVYNNLILTITIYLLLIGVWNFFEEATDYSYISIIVPFALFGGFLGGTNTKMGWSFVGRNALLFLLIVVVSRLIGFFVRKKLKLKE